MKLLMDVRVAVYMVLRLVVRDEAGLLASLVLFGKGEIGF